MLDLEREHAELEEPLRDAFERVLSSGRFILGEEVERFEAEAAKWLGAAHAIGVSSGTDALSCALTALGVGPGDEVITTAFSFIATGEAIVRAGARPCFVDVDPSSYNLDLDQVAAAIGPRTRAIVPVHLFGEPVRMDELEVIAAHHGVAIVEDAAQAFGALYAGRRAGTWGTLGCFSFFPSKPLGALGDGGMIVTADADLAARCRALRSHGRSRGAPCAPRVRGDSGSFGLLGGNYRLDALQAAFLRVKLEYVERALTRRRHHARAYTRALSGVGDVRVPLAGVREARLTDRGSTEPARARDATVSAWAQYTVRVPESRRDALSAFLADRGIETAVHYRLPLHREPALGGARVLGGELVQTEALCREVISLPLHPALTDAERTAVVSAVREFSGSTSRADQAAPPPS